MPADPLPDLFYSRQCIDEDDVRAVAETLRGDFLTTGPKVAEFEQRISGICGAKHAVAVANGTVALHLAVMALDLPAGFTGITTPLTFAASANAFLYCGGRPDLVDIGADSPNLCPGQLEKRLAVGTAQVLIPVSYAGFPADLPRIQALAQRHGARTIEDASHSFGSTYQYAGSTFHSGSCAHSDMAVFSFHPVKNITCAEGGMVTTNDDALAARLRQLRNHGITRQPAEWQGPGARGAEPGPLSWYYETQSLGFNARLSDLHAALGVSQLGKWQKFKSSKRELFLAYNEAFDGVPGLRLPVFAEMPPCDPFHHLYPLRVERAAHPGLRSELMAHLASQRIFGQVHYVPLHWHPHFQRHLVNPSRTYPHAEDFYLSELSLPLHPGLDKAGQERVIRAVLEFCAGRQA